jgi:hypothetical protein
LKVTESDHQGELKMAGTSSETTGIAPDIEAAAQRIKQTRDRVLELIK